MSGERTQNGLPMGAPFASPETEPENNPLRDLNNARNLPRTDPLEWERTLSIWGGTPRHVDDFIKGQQARIHAVQDVEKELQDAFAALDDWETAFEGWGVEAETAKATILKERDEALAISEKLIRGCERIEGMVEDGAYLKFQDGSWWLFWESSGEVAAGPAVSLYGLALALG